MLLVAIVDESVQCVLLNDDVDLIVRRARSKQSMRWFYTKAQATVLLKDGFACAGRRATRRRLQAGRQTAATGST